MMWTTFLLLAALAPGQAGAPPAPEAVATPAPEPPARLSAVELLLDGTRLGLGLRNRDIRITGWTSGNFTGSSAGVSNAPVAFNDFANAGQLNQNWLDVSKAIDPERNVRQWGFRYATILPGSDARYTIARGLGTVGTSDYPIDPMVFGYGELFLPNIAGQSTTIRLGKWGSSIGSEVIDAVSVPFVSRSYNFIYNPFTHSGVQVSTTLNDSWSIYNGVVTGCDVFLDPAGTPTYVGGIKRTFKDSKGSLALNVVVSDANYNVAEQFANSNSFNLIFTRNFNQRLTYVFDSTYSEIHNVPGLGHANWYGFANYLIRKHDNEKVVSNLRAEFFTDSQGFRTGTAGTYLDLTYGITWTATERLLVKPFVRYDYNRRGAFEGNDSLYTGGLELIAKW